MVVEARETYTLFPMPIQKELVNMKEIWKDVPNFENLYQISNYGRLKSFRKNKNGIILKKGS